MCYGHFTVWVSSCMFQCRCLVVVWHAGFMSWRQFSVPFSSSCKHRELNCRRLPFGSAKHILCWRLSGMTKVFAADGAREAGRQFPAPGRGNVLQIAGQSQKELPAAADTGACRGFALQLPGSCGLPAQLRAHGRHRYETRIPVSQAACLERHCHWCVASNSKCDIQTTEWYELKLQIS